MHYAVCMFVSWSLPEPAAVWPVSVPSCWPPHPVLAESLTNYISISVSPAVTSRAGNEPSRSAWLAQIHKAAHGLCTLRQCPIRPSPWLWNLRDGSVAALVSRQPPITQQVPTLHRVIAPATGKPRIQEKQICATWPHSKTNIIDGDTTNMETSWFKNGMQLGMLANYFLIQTFTFPSDFPV